MGLGRAVDRSGSDVLCSYSHSAGGRGLAGVIDTMSRTVFPACAANLRTVGARKIRSSCRGQEDAKHFVMGSEGAQDIEMRDPLNLMVDR